MTIENNIFVIMPHNKSILQRLMTGGAWSLIARVLGAFSILFINVLLVRLLKPVDFGLYTLAFSFVQFGSMLGMVGMQMASVRFISESLTKNDLNQAFIVANQSLQIGLFGLFIVGTIYWAISPWLAGKIFNAPTLSGTTGLIIGGWIFFYGKSFLIADIFRGFHDLFLASFFQNILYQLLLLPVIGFLLFLQISSLITVLNVSCIVAAAVGIWSFLLLKLRSKKNSNTKQLKTENTRITSALLIKVGLPLLIGALTVRLLNDFSFWSVGWLCPEEDVALYGSVYRLVIIITMPQLIVNGVIQPIISELHAKNRLDSLEVLLQGTATIAGLPAIVGMIILCVFSEQVLGILYPSFYGSAAPLLIILCIGRIIGIATGSSDIVLCMTGYQGIVMRASCISFVVCVILSIFLTSYFGATGAAVAAAAAFIFYKIILLVYTKRVLGIYTNITFDFNTAAPVIDYMKRKV